jgi:hypothetical protein
LIELIEETRLKLEVEYLMLIEEFDKLQLDLGNPEYFCEIKKNCDEKYTAMILKGFKRIKQGLLDKLQ